MEKRVYNAGRRMSKILRHDTEGLEMDNKGYIFVDPLIEKLGITPSELDEIVEKNNKKRFSYNKDKTKIKANQGHSLKIDLELEEIVPPNRLYHGTSIKNSESILREGIKKGSRHHVHLTDNIDTAFKVGERHGKACIFIVHCDNMTNAGIKFYLSKNGVYLVNHVDSKYLTLINSKYIK